MSILSTQNINKYDEMPDQIPGTGSPKWEANLGQDPGRIAASEAAVSPGWGGYTWGPPLEDNPLGSDIGYTGELAGPTGLPQIMGVIKDEEYGEHRPAQYGPVGFAQLTDSTNPDNATGASYSSVLTAFAYMIALGAGHDWDDTPKSPGARMKTTFTLTPQSPSLSNKFTIPTGKTGAGQPVASGGGTNGYQHGHRYEISNWNDTGTQLLNSASREEINNPTSAEPGEDTGLRNMDSMVVG